MEPEEEEERKKTRRGRLVIEVSGLEDRQEIDTGIKGNKGSLRRHGWPW